MIILCILASELSCHVDVFHVKAKATADISTEAGIGSSSVLVKADGKDRLMLDSQMSHSLQRGQRSVGLRLKISQSLLPAVTDIHVNMTANISSDRSVPTSSFDLVFISNTMTNLKSYLHFCFLLDSCFSSVSLHSSYTQGHEALLAQVKGSLKDIRGPQLAVSGDLRHSMTNLAFLPSALGLDGALGQSDTLIEGRD